MGFPATVLKVLIASPGDVAAEREAITSELYRWNDANADSRNLVLQPVKWETHSSPQMGAHPQAIINKQLLLDADIVVAIFSTRVGTATPHFISGTVEEITRHVSAGKLAMLYFSRAPVDPESIDPEQLTALKAFKSQYKATGLYAEYDSVEHLRTRFAGHLAIELNKPKHLGESGAGAIRVREPDLNANEKRLLVAAAKDTSGRVLSSLTMDGFHVSTNGESFVENSPRSEPAWKRVLQRLAQFGYLTDTGHGIYEVTDKGFDRSDEEAAKLPLELALSLAGTPDNQLLSIKASKPISPKQLDFLTSSRAHITTAELDGQSGEIITVPLDPMKIVELVNSPRPDKSTYDHSGPAALRLVFTSEGRRREVVMPILLQSSRVANTRYFQLIGAETFTLGPQ